MGEVDLLKFLQRFCDPFHQLVFLRCACCHKSQVSIAEKHQHSKTETGKETENWCWNSRATKSGNSRGVYDETVGFPFTAAFEDLL